MRKLFAYLSRTSCGCGGSDGSGGRRERREGPAESEGDSPRTLLRAELFSASIRFHRRRNMRAATSPTITTPGDGSDGGGPKNRRRLSCRSDEIATVNNVQEARGGAKAIRGSRYPRSDIGIEEQVDKNHLSTIPSKESFHKDGTLFLLDLGSILISV